MTTLGRYRLDSLIASGSMAEVHAGTDTTLLRKVAIKLPHRHLWADATARERFLREGRAIAGLSHEHIVHLYDLGESEDRLYLAMEYVEGLSLDRWLEKTGSLPPLVVFALLWQILKGVCAAHSHGLLHRDIKPANLLLTPQGHLKIADFGLSRLMGASALSATEAFIGTPRYAAPEVASGGLHTEKSDVFSAALVALEMLAGKPAILADDPHIALLALREGRFENSQVLAPTAPPGMHRVLAAMLKLDAEARITAGEALANLETYAREQRIHLGSSRVADYLQADPTQRLALQEQEKGELATLWRAEAEALTAAGQMATAHKSRIIVEQLQGGTQTSDPPLAPGSNAKKGLSLKAKGLIVAVALVLGLILFLGFNLFHFRDHSGQPTQAHKENKESSSLHNSQNGIIRPESSLTTTPEPVSAGPLQTTSQSLQPHAFQRPTTPRPEPATRTKVDRSTSSSRAVSTPTPLPNSEPAVLRLLTRPGLTDVFIDGRPHGKTPTAWIALSPGSHRIRLERQGWQTLEEDLILEPADSLEWRRELRRDESAP